MTPLSPPPYSEPMVPTGSYVHDEFPQEPESFNVECAPAVRSASIDVHDVLRGVVAQLAEPIRSKRLEVSLRLLARNHYLAGDPDRLRASVTGLVRRAIEMARAGSRLTLRSSRPADCALRIEIEERSPWMRQATSPAPAAARLARASTAHARSRSNV